jgi:CheY-like chemotaxis protein
VDVCTAVANALETAQLSLREREHTVALSLPNEPLRIEADPVRLEQIIVNLLSNAGKYTPPQGRIAVAVARDGDDVVIPVSDNGIGIAPDLLPRVFDLFKQGDRSLAHSAGGLGIGLTVVQKLVALHGGSVTAHSGGLGLGSEFVVRLPAGRAATASHARDAPVAESASSGAIHILIIDDDAATQQMFRAYLESAGHRVDIAEDPLTGVQTAMAKRPRIALIGAGLRGPDAYAVAQKIRGLLGNSVRLIGMVTDRASEEDPRTAASAFDDFLVKPVTAEELLRAIATPRQRPAAGIA